MNSGSQIGLELLRPLASQAGHQRILTLVDRVEVAADADAGLPVETNVAAGLGPVHEEHPLPVADDDVGNQLLVGRVLLGRRPIEVSAIARDRRPQRLQVGIAGSTDSVEVASAGDGDPGQDQDAFGHRESLSAARRRHRRGVRKVTRKVRALG